MEQQGRTMEAANANRGNAYNGMFHLHIETSDTDQPTVKEVENVTVIA